jgi:thioredoxin 1
MKLLQFKANWCGPCRQQTKEFEENPVDVEVVAIDIDEDEAELSTKYGIRSIPTMILIGDNDEMLHRWTGYTKSSTINEFINESRGIAAP